VHANRIRTLGGFAVTLRGVGVGACRAGRSRQLLQYFVSRAGELLPSHTLIDDVWADSAARNPHTALKVAVCGLRKSLAAAHAHGGRTGTPDVWIVSGPGWYRLLLHDTEVDVDVFEAAVRDGNRLTDAGEHAAAGEQYRRAVQLYGGAYLPGSPDAWAAVRRERVNDKLLDALTALAADARDRGDRHQLLDLHQRMLDVDPCREESYRELMRWHGLAGQPARVFDWYRVCTEQLHTRLGLAPGRQTQQLYAEAVSGRLASGPLVPGPLGAMAHAGRPRT
jgi:DNA-binding SARP family transcriptional activator